MAKLLHFYSVIIERQVLFFYLYLTLNYNSHVIFCDNLLSEFFSFLFLHICVQGNKIGVINEGRTY